jgi:predicted  nucleic acid-binding Zn-ribbon protein
MTKEETIISKLYEAKKIELGTHKVDLGLVDDFNKMSNSFFTQSQKFENAVQKIESNIKEMQTQFIEVQKISSEIDSNYQKVRKSASDLGVSIPVELENDYKRVLASLKNDLATFKTYNK